MDLTDRKTMEQCLSDIRVLSARVGVWNVSPPPEDMLTASPFMGRPTAHGLWACLMSASFVLFLLCPILPHLLLVRMRPLIVLIFQMRNQRHEEMNSRRSDYRDQRGEVSPGGGSPFPQSRVWPFHASGLGK